MQWYYWAAFCLPPDPSAALDRLQLYDSVLYLRTNASFLFYDPCCYLTMIILYFHLIQIYVTFSALELRSRSEIPVSLG